MSTNFLGLRHKYYAITITASDDNTQSVIERNYNMEEILKQIALENGTTVSSVKREIEFAIHEAMNSPQSRATGFGMNLPMMVKNHLLKPLLQQLSYKSRIR